MENNNTGVTLKITEIAGILLKILSVILLVVGTICNMSKYHGFDWDSEVLIIIYCALIYGIGEIISALKKIKNFGIGVMIGLLQEIKNNTDK